MIALFLFFHGSPGAAMSLLSAATRVAPEEPSDQQAAGAWGVSDSDSSTSGSEEDADGEQNEQPEVRDDRGRCCAICGSWSSEAIILYKVSK